MALSRIPCEKMIKSSQVVLNGAAVVDSGCILHESDRISILTASECVNLERAVNAVKMHHKTDTIVVAFKSVGMRMIGSFSDCTLLGDDYFGTD
jgi:16S rRNA U516 pseudouridylate synthase RsuA-like enzyme